MNKICLVLVTLLVGQFVQAQNNDFGQNSNSISRRIQTPNRINSVISIAAAKQRNIRDTVTIRGVVSMGTMGGNTRYMFDGTGGIGLFTPTSLVPAFNYNVGDSIEVRGLLDSYKCLYQIGTIYNHSLIQANVPFRINEYTIANIDAAYAEENIGKIVRINDLTTLNNIPDGTPATTFTSAGSGTNFRLNNLIGKDIRILPGTDINGFAVPTPAYSVTGVIGRFINVTPNNDRVGCTAGQGYQLIPRSRADIQAGTLAFRLRFLNPQDGETIRIDSGANYSFNIQISNPPVPVSRVTYYLDGDSVAVSTTAPFNFPINFGQSTIAPVQVIAIAYAGTQSASDTINFSIVLSSNERLAKEIKMYPNPAKSAVKISSATLAISNISIFNTAGKLLLNNSGTGIEDLNLEGLASGYYLVKVLTDKGLVNLKLIKE